MQRSAERREPCALGVGGDVGLRKAQGSTKEREATSRGDMGTGGTEENWDRGRSDASLGRIEWELGTGTGNGLEFPSSPHLRIHKFPSPTTVRTFGNFFFVTLTYTSLLLAFRKKTKY